MTEFFAPLSSEYTLVIPDTPSALIAWVLISLGIVFLGIMLRDRSIRLDRSSLVWFASLTVLILIVTPFMGIFPRMSPILESGALPVKHLMFFAALPWMIAGGVLGVLPATILAGLSGLWLAYLDTHNVFTPLVMMAVAVTFSWSVRQRYRTKLFTWLRFPIIAALFSIVATSPLVFIVLVLSASGSSAVRIAAAMARFPVVMFTLGGMVLVGGAVCVIVQAIAQDGWGLNTALRPAPGEVHFRYRLLGFAVPIFFLVLAGVLVSTWSVAQNQARRQIVKQLTAVTGHAAESLRIFIDTGDRLLISLAKDPQLVSGSAEDINTILAQNLEGKTFFEGIALYDVEGNLITGVPASMVPGLLPVVDLNETITMLSAHSRPITIRPGSEQDEADISVDYLIGVGDQPDQVQAILWGRTELDQNHYARVVMAILDELVQLGGDVFIVNDKNILLFHAGDSDVFNIQASVGYPTATFFQTTTLDGRSQAYYFQPVDGTGWGITSTLPAVLSQEMAWETTYPVLMITTAVMSIIFLACWVGLSPIVNEIETMTLAINAVASGAYDLDQLENKRTLSKRSYFNPAFKHMLSLHKNRIARQTKLFSVSAGVAGQQKLTESLHIILTSALEQGASDARIVLSKTTANDLSLGSEHRFGVGQHMQQLAALDQAVFSLARSEGPLVLHHDEIRARLSINEDMPGFATIVLQPLWWPDQGSGVFWVTYTQTPTPENEVIEFLQELARIATMAIVNARTNQDSQMSSALMKSLIDLTPDPILIVDQAGQVLFYNSHVKQMLGIKGPGIDSLKVSQLFAPEDLAAINWGVNQPPLAKEIRLLNGKAYQLYSAPMRIKPQTVARAMIFKDLTQQRKQDALKTEFVTTVSHELRSPLKLILGYAKILRLTGNLSEQQESYISNIIDGVEEMNGLVQKLLEIAHLEGDDPLEMRPFSVEQMVKKVVESQEAQAKQKNITLNITLPEEPLVIEGDQTFLTQALKNLLDNAIKFSKMNGAVTLNVRPVDERVSFSVRDEGIGIAPLDQRHLFKKFSRISPNTGIEYGGSGLGLAIVKSIAERHGGQVWLESQLGKGSTFFMEIPRTRQDQSKENIKFVPGKI